MNDWNSAQVATAAAAQVICRGISDRGPKGVTIDSRSVSPGDLFIGLPGTRADGGDFARQALEAGAWGVLVQRDYVRSLFDESAGAVLACANPVLSLGRLAQAWRRHLDLTVIAITGSIGKTSTKDILVSLLGSTKRVTANVANFNTEIGLPLTLLGITAGTEIAVVELGMRGFGEIRELTEICEPNVGLITNIAPVHLERLGSIEGIAQAKAELLEAMKPGTVAVLPKNEPLLAPYLRRDLKTITFGSEGNVEYATKPDIDPERDFQALQLLANGEPVELELPLRGHYQSDNVLAAVAASLAVGVRPGGRFEPQFSPLRGELVHLGNGAVLINDCYNANPVSVPAAVQALSMRPVSGRRIAVLGDMLELGPDSERYHREVGNVVRAHAAVDLLITVGDHAHVMCDQFDRECYAVVDAGAAADLLKDLLDGEDLVLIKGSRGLRLEEVAQTLTETYSLSEEVAKVNANG